MTKRTGQCKNCGNDNSPRGNVFDVVRVFEIEAGIYDGASRTLRFDLPRTDLAKVCRNCGCPHDFTPRKSAKSKSKEAMLDWLINEAAA